MNNNKGKNLFAIIFISMGILLVLQNFNITLFEKLSIGYMLGILWPLFILVPGLNMLKVKVGLPGIILTTLGGSFLLGNVLKIIGIDFNSGWIFKFIWPGILIYIGYTILNSKSRSSNSKNYTGYTDNTSDRSNNITFSAREYKYTKENLDDGITKLNLNIAFGGAEIIVEEGIQVILIGQYTLGGHEFFHLSDGGVYSEIKQVRYNEDENSFDKTLLIKANITLGGLEIR